MAVRAVEAYFPSKVAAESAATALGSRYKVSAPQPVTPRNGRSWLIEITMPPGFGFGRTDYNPETMNWVVTVVQKYDGWLHNTED